MNPLDGVFGDEGDVLKETNFQLLLVSNLVYPYGTTFISPLLESLVGPFGTTPSKIGLLLTAFYVPAILLTPVVGVLTDTYGRKPLLVTGLVLFGTGGVAIATTTEFRVILGLRVLQGFGAGCLLPVVVASIGDLYSDNREVTAQGLRTGFHSLSAAVAPLVAGVLILFGWRYPFLIYSVALVFAAALLLWFEEPSTSVESTPDGGGTADRRELFSRPVVALSIAGFTVPSIIFVTFLTYASFIVVRGTSGSAQLAGVLVSMAAVASALAGSQSGRLTEAAGGKAVPLAIGNAALGLGLVVVAVAPSYLGAVAGTVVLGTGFGILMTLYRSVFTALGPESLRGTLVSVSEGVRTSGNAVTPLVAGFVVAAFQPSVGLLTAVRWTAVAIGVLGGTAGILCILLVREELPTA